MRCQNSLMVVSPVRAGGGAQKWAAWADRWHGTSTLTPTRAYDDAGYLSRNVRTIEILIDRDAVISGAAAAGEPWQHYDLGHGSPPGRMTRRACDRTTLGTWRKTAARQTRCGGTARMCGSWPASYAGTGRTPRT